MDMNYQKLADLLFPHVTETPAECEAKFPARNLPEGAKVTRFAPSPTGFVHFGGLFPVMVGERLAHQSGGVFYLRIEDTDAKREVPGAAEGLITTLERYGIHFDEGAILGPDGKVTDIGDYGPYKQSLRASLYHVFAKKLVAEGKAYPVFTTEEELDALKAADKKAEIKNVDWEAEAAARKAEMEAAGHKVYLVSNDVVEVSSTNLRRMLIFRCADPFLPKGVGEYIRQNRLYGVDRDYRKLPMEELEQVVISLLKPNRVAHVLGCRDTAVELAKRWGADDIDAARAGNPDCEFVLVATMLANPEASNFAGCQKDYLPALLELEEEGIVVMDMTTMHENLLTRKRYYDMTGNNVNHPNDFLARAYAQNLWQTVIGY